VTEDPKEAGLRKILILDIHRHAFEKLIFGWPKAMLPLRGAIAVGMIVEAWLSQVKN